MKFLEIKVQNVSNDKVHFARIIDVNDNIIVPYDSIINVLLFIFKPLKVKNCYRTNK